MDYQPQPSCRFCRHAVGHTAIRFALLASIACLFLLIVGATPAAAQNWNNGYSYRRTITIDHRKVANSDQLNFPVAISGTYAYLATTTNGGSVTNANGYDIIFTSDEAGTQVLTFEQESYSPSTGAVAYWVLIPILSHTTDSVIYIFYGNSAVTTDQSNKTGVWDSNYQGVWHLGNGSALSTGDSSSSGNNGMFENVTATTGLIDGAGSFNGTSAYIATTKTYAWPLTVSSEAWVNTTSTSGHKVSGFETSQTGTGSSNFDFNLYVDTNGKAVTTCYNGYYTTVTSNAGVNDGAWHQLATTLDYTSHIMTLYVDGAPQGSTNCNNTVALTGYFRIGGYKLWPWTNDTDGYFSGTIDEVRLSSIVRSPDWIATEYNNQKNPPAFYNVGGANPPTISGLTPNLGTIGTTVTIAGTGFGSTQGSSVVAFNGVTATPTTWGNTRITVPVPSGAVSGNVVVTVSGSASNGAWFTVPGTWANNYSYQRALTISHTQVPNSDQVNFPVLISGTYSYLATTSNSGNVTSSSGYDIIFTSDSAGLNTLPFEQESYNPTTGAVIYWVQVPTLSHTTDTTIYMFYGNSSVSTDQSNKHGVWDSNYKGVWHLPNGTTLSASDSTSNGNNGVSHSAAAATGQIDGAASVNSGSYIDVGSNLSVNGTTTFAASAWIKPNGSFSGSYPLILSPINGQASIGFYSNTMRPYVTFHYGSSNYHDLDSGYTTSTGNWYYVVGTYDGHTESIYVNGVLQASAAYTDSITNNSTLDAVIGENIGNGAWLNATIDEARFSTSSRSADWIATEYNNQINPATFYIASSVNPPTILSLSALSGSPGTSITITGSFFGSTQGSSTVTFGGTVASPTSWSSTSIAVPVPSGAASSDVVVTVAGVPSNAVWFIVPTNTLNGSGSTYWRRITIDHTKVPHTDQINFPVLISGTYSYLATTSNGGNVTSSNGYDIIFTSDPAGLNVLPFEQENYNPSTGAVNYWVKVPVLSHTSDTVIYMFYGNPGITTSQSSNAVWDSNYQGVWHLPNGTTLSADDSTSNSNSGAIQGTVTATAGQIDGAGNFDGSTGYVSTTNSFGWPFSLTNEAWVNTTSTAGHKVSSWETAQTGTGAAGFDALLYVDTNGKARGGCWNGATTTITSSSAVNDGNWHHLALTLDTSSNVMALYVDGASQGTVSCADTGGGTYYFRIGSYKLSGWPNGSDGYFGGNIDEVRFSNTARSSDWIATEYNNQTNPSTFCSVSIAFPPVITSLSPNSGSVGAIVTIAGTKFGATQGGSTVTFGGVSASPTSWSDSAITVPVPSGAVSGNVVVSVSGSASNGAWFTVPGTWANNYGYQRALTISHTQVANSDQMNFPVLISGTYSYLATTSNGGDVNSSNGYDIIFTSDSTGLNTLPFELETYNPTTGTVSYWVKVPVLSHTTDTVIYMFYGNSAVTTDQSNKTGVWDTNYKGVWHLGNGSTVSGNDSTTNGYSLANNNSVAATTGVISGAASFNGTSNYLSNSSLSIASGSAITVSYWNYVASANAGSAFTIGASDNPNRIQANDPWSDSNLYWDYGSWSGGGRVSTSYSGYLNSWAYTVLEFDPTTDTHAIYLNGTLVASTVNSNSPTSTQTGIDIGAWPTGAYEHGNIDEFRVSTIVRSGDWIATEYNNQNGPSAFCSFGAPNVPVISSVTPHAGIAGTTITVDGTRFGSTQGSSTVTFNGSPGSPTSWSDSSIVVPVPTSATSGNIVVTVAGTPSNPVWFTVSGTSATGYRYRNAITIDHTKVPNTDQVDFPVLISGTYSYLATSGNGGSVTNANGYDIVFASDLAGLHTLPFEQESYNASTGAVIYWVSVPTLSHTTDTVIYMFYGNPGITTSQASKTVWDSYYKAVWHLDQDPTGSVPQVPDSTANGNNATAQGTWSSSAQVGGQIGGSLSFTSANSDYLSTANSFNNPGTETVQAWFKSTSTSGTKIIGFENAQTGTGSSNYDRQIWLGTDGKVHGGLICTYPGSLTTGSTYNDGNWHQAALTVDVSAQQAKLYVDGAQAASTSCSGPQNFTGYYRIGSYQLLYWNNGSGGYFNGSLDEARISLIARSGDWVATEYHNQNSPSTFFSVSSQAILQNPIIGGLSSTTGAVGASITISGAGFGSSQGTSTVSFNGTGATPTSWNTGSIVVPVPSGAATGNVVVTVSGIPSNGVSFMVTGTLSGTVTRQSDGTDINGASVQVLQDRSVIATTNTASNGTYSVANLVTGEYDVAFSATGFGTVLQAAVAVSSSGLTLNQSLSTPGTISGQVTQSNGTTAISGATITVLQAGETVGTASTNGTGNYSVATLGAGSYEVEASATGYVNQGLTGVLVTGGNTTTENFSLNSVGVQPISYVYDSLGRLTAAIDQSGNVAVYAYDPVGNILSISRGSAQQLSVMTFSPTTGSVGSTVTIYGTAFSPTPSQNTVKFNGTAAVVSSATVTSLVVTVPSGATTGTISVTTSSGTATSSASFTVSSAGAGQPSISSFTPSIGTPGTSVSISGTSFETTSANDRVKFNAAYSSASSATTSSLSVAVPNGGTSGHLVLRTPAGTATSTNDFFVPPGTFTASNVGYTNRVSVGGNLTVTISTAGQIGLVVFDGTAGHRVGVLTSSDTMTSTNGATAISIDRPDGTTVVTQTVTTSTPFIVPQNLIVGGTYTVVVQPSSSATGSITVALYDVPADVNGSISINGSSVPVTISQPGQAGTLKFSGTNGQQITVHATSNTINGVTVTLEDPLGNVLASQNSNASSFNLSSVTLAGSGTFSVLVSPTQPNTGSISISLTNP
jgi:YD repeat-containing protein